MVLSVAHTTSRHHNHNPHKQSSQRHESGATRSMMSVSASKRGNSTSTDNRKRMVRWYVWSLIALWTLLALDWEVWDINKYALESETETEPESESESATDSSNDSNKESKSSNNSNSNTKPYKVYHVINIFFSNKDDSKKSPVEFGDEEAFVRHHQPLDQWATLRSITRAREHASDLLVESESETTTITTHQRLELVVVCAMLQSDLDFYERKMGKERPIHGCNEIVLLPRSTATEYGTTNAWSDSNPNHSDAKASPEILSKFYGKRELIFLQDILEAGASVANANRSSNNNKNNKNNSNMNHDDPYYVMLTNPDIGLTKTFYGFLVNVLEQDREAFTINRWTTPMNENKNFKNKSGKNKNKNKNKNKFDSAPAFSVTEPTTDPDSIETFFDEVEKALEFGKPHPGFDCFVIRSSILPKIDLGNLFVGFPPWGSVLRRLLKKHLARSTFREVPSSPEATFHLGDQRKWFDKNSNKDYTSPVMKLLENENDESEKDKENSDGHGGHHHTRSWVERCPIQLFSREPFTYLNTANCGRVFAKLEKQE